MRHLLKNDNGNVGIPLLNIRATLGQQMKTLSATFPKTSLSDFTDLPIRFKADQYRLANKNAHRGNLL